MTDSANSICTAGTSTKIVVSSKNDSRLALTAVRGSGRGESNEVRPSRFSGLLEMQTRAAAARAQRRAMRHPQAEEAFTQGVGSLLRQWTALELAVFHQWGGDDSRETAARLVDEIRQLFESEDRVYKDVSPAVFPFVGECPQDVSLLLEDYLESNFSTICEDESPDELGMIICDLYSQCGEGNFELVNSLTQKEALRKGVVSQSIGCDKGDDIDEDDDEENDQENEAAMEEALTEELPKVDPEGWEVVSKRKRPSRK